MSHDDLDHIPSIVPTREGVPQRSTRRTPTERRRSPGGQTQAPPSGGGSGVFVYLIAGLALIAAGLAFAWAWQLQNQFEQATNQLQDYAARIGDLEARLSDTDEGMNQNAAVQAVKVAELETEVRKLWDNVWKQTRERLDKLEAASGGYARNAREIDSALAKVKSQLAEASSDIAGLKSVGGDMARLMSSAKSNQAQVERMADNLNKINLTLTRLEQRVASNEEWLASVNAFRQQVNTRLSELQTMVRAGQANP